MYGRSSTILPKISATCQKYHALLPNLLGQENSHLPDLPSLPSGRETSL